jgi:hypothetical protein
VHMVKNSTTEDTELDTHTEDTVFFYLADQT